MHSDEGKKRGGCRKADIEESERSNAMVVLSHTIKQAAKNSNVIYGATQQTGQRNTNLNTLYANLFTHCYDNTVVVRIGRAILECFFYL
jgi:hypothetical protein